MNKMAYKRVVVIGILTLFVGASVLPVMSGTIQNLDIMKNPGKQKNPHQLNIQNNPKIHVETNKKTDTKVQQQSEKNNNHTAKPQKAKQITVKEKHIPALPSFTYDASASPRSIGNGGGPQPLANNVHNQRTGLNYLTIQEAINAAATLNGDTLIVSAGTYPENVLVSKSLTIQGTNASNMPVIDGMGFVCFNITANSVTMKWLNFTNATNAINCSASGFTIINNTFYYVTNGVVWSIYKTNLAASQTILASTVNYNTFYSSDATPAYKAMIYVDVELYYQYNSGYTVSIGAITINHNSFYLNSSTQTSAIYIDAIYVYYLYGGTVTVGKIDISGNTMYGGLEGCDFYGEFYQLKNVQLTVGDFTVMNNMMMNQTDYGMYIDYYDGESWSGTTHAVFGTLQITDNMIQSNNGAEGIEVDDYGYWYNYTGTASLQVGDMIIQDNDINVTNYGIYFVMEEIGDGSDSPLADHSSVTLGDFTIDDNTVTTSGNDGIYIYIDDVGYEMYDYAAFTMGDFTCNSNTITTGYVIEYDNISDSVHLTRGYNRGLYNAVTESAYQHYYSPANTVWSNIYATPQADPANLTFTDWEDAVSANPPSMVGQVIYMHIISENRTFQMNFTYWQQEGGGGFSYTRYEVVGGVVGPGVAYSHQNVTGSGGDGIYVDDIDYIGEEMNDYSTCTIGNIQFNDNTIHTTGSNSYGIDLSWIGDIGEDMYGHAQCTMGNIESNDNTIVVGDGVGVYIDYGDFGYDMGDTASDHCVFTMGDITCNGNTITNSGDDGIYVSDIYDIGYDMYGTSTCTIGNIQFDNNMIHTNDYDGLYFDFIGDFGYDMYDNSQFTMGNLESDSNTIYAGDGYGIYIDYSEFGYYMGDSEVATDHCVYTMGDITCNNNDVTNSGSEGIYTEDLDDLGYDMYGYSTFTMGNIQFNHNMINTSDDSGLYLYDPERFGEDMYDQSQFTMGNLEANDNTIYAGDGNGIYLYYDEFGYYLGTDESTDHCVFVMGDITCNNNSIINSGGEGLYVEYLDEIGYGIYGRSTCTIGNIEFNDNDINTSDYSGMYFDYVGEFGYDMYDLAQFTMGHFSVNNNNIHAGDGYGIYFEYKYMGYDMGDDIDDTCVFTMGDITWNNNTITNSGDEGIYCYDLDHFGENMYGSSTYTMGNIQFNHNNVNTTDSSAIYLWDPEEYGLYMNENSQYTMGNLEVNYNTAYAGNGNGIYLYYDDFGYSLGSYEDVGTLGGSGDVNAHCIFTMGDITCDHNTITNSGGHGIYLDEFYDVGSEMYGSSSCTIGNITFNDNVINTTGDDGIYFYDTYDFGYDMYDSSVFTMGSIQVNNNIIQSVGGYGIDIDWLGDIGEYMYDNSTATMGSIEINNNMVNDSSGDGIYASIGDIGYDIYNNAQFTMGDVTINYNNITSGGDGIYLDDTGYIGTEEIYDDATAITRGMIVAFNTINATDDGIRADYTDHVIVAANTIVNAVAGPELSVDQGIYVLDYSDHMKVIYNALNGMTSDGIFIDTSDTSTILGNIINASQTMNGIHLADSYDNTILRNVVSNNSGTGINVTTSTNNTIYHNNILNNTLQAYDDSDANNTWDNGYPSGGNYWSDHVSPDAFRGPNQDTAGSDGIVDTPYDITGYTPNDQDQYPLTDRVVLNHPSLYTPSNPSPANGATQVSINTDTSWTGGDPDNDYDNYDVYFGTTNPPVYYDTVYFVQGSPISFIPGTLAMDTTYYWQIVAWDTFNDSVSGPVWSFSTGAPSHYQPPPVVYHYAPTADPDGPYSGVVNTAVQFDGTHSHTNGDGGTIVAYDWKFSDSDTFHNLGPTPTHTYTTAGTYTVTLRVTDSENGIGIGSTTAVIRGVNSPPAIPTIAGPATGNVNTAYTYSVTTTDPDNNNIQYFIDWGDGTAKTSSPFVPSGQSYTGAHTWASSGVYAVKVYAEDVYGGISGTATYYVTIGTPTTQPLNGYLVDTNGDGILDSWHNNVTGQTTAAQKQADGTWLIDVNGDGVWDYVYNPVTGTYSPYSAAPSGGLPGPWIWGGAAVIIIIILILFFLLWRRRKKDEAEQQKKK